MATAINLLDSSSIHRIQSGQVIVDLCSVVKELIENSIDARATSIDVRFKNQGLETIEVQDNGSGIEPKNYPFVALKHHTSKISSFSDVAFLQSFGFRGEALASLCALSNVVVTTCVQDNVPKGSKLSFETSGKLKNTAVVAAQRGTTVSVDSLFFNLPVRRRELERNIKREWQKVIVLLNQYACIQTNVKFTVSQQPSKGKRIVLFATNGNPSTRENIINIFGAKIMSSLISLDLDFELKAGLTGSNVSSKNCLTRASHKVLVVGHVSRPSPGNGRQTPDRQMFFVNGRSCGLPQFAKVFNEVYRSFNCSQSPFILADVHLNTHLYDVNVSPDKRSILLHEQSQLLDTLRCSLAELFNSHDCTVPLTQPVIANNFNFNTAVTCSQDNSFTKPRLESQKSLSEKFESDDYEIYSRSEGPELGPSSGELSSKDSRLSSDAPPRNLEHQPQMTGQLMNASEVASSSTSSSPTLMPDINETKKKSRLNSASSQSLDRLNVSSRGNIYRESVEEQISKPTVNAQAKTLEKSPVGLDGENSPAFGIVDCSSVSGAPILQSSILISKSRYKSHAPAVNTVEPDNCDIDPPSSRNLFKQSRASTRVLTIENNVTDTPLVSEGMVSSDAATRLGLPGHHSGDTSQNLRRPLSPSGIADDLESARRSVSGEVATYGGSDLKGTKTQSGIADTDDADMRHLNYRFDITTHGEDIIDLVHDSASLDRASLRHLEGDSNQTSTFSSATQHIHTNEISMQLRMNYCISNWRVENQQKSNSYDIGEIDASDAESKLTLTVSRKDLAQLQIIGQFNLGFIISKRPTVVLCSENGGTWHDELFIIDQHASDEKYNFERLQSTTVVQSQRLVQPKRLQLSALEEEAVMGNLKAIEASGFKISVDATGISPVGSRCQVLALPLTRETTFSLEDLDELIALLRDEPLDSGHIPRPSKMRKIFAMRACRSSVMVGKALTRNQMYTLVRQMGTLDNPWNCPHGRPTMRHLCRLDSWDKRCWGSDSAAISPSTWHSYARSN